MKILHKGASLFYTDEGSGRTVVLVHGFLENSQMWQAFRDTLTAQYRIITVDLPGHGQSENISYLHTMEDMADAIHSLIQALKIDSLSWIGHSMGGYIGCAYAKKYPDFIDALCLLQSTPLPDSKTRKQQRQRAAAMAQSNYKALVRMSFLNLFTPAAKKAFPELIHEALEQAQTTSAQGYVAATLGMAERADHSDFWKQTLVYTGMILGKEDPLIDAEKHKRRFDQTTAFFEIIAGGHMPHITHPDQSLTAIENFLKRSDQRLE